MCFIIKAIEARYIVSVRGSTRRADANEGFLELRPVLGFC
jgi:hypothetical protein